MAKIFLQHSPKWPQTGLCASVRPLKYHSGVLVPEEIRPV